jgi:hypothetical protein
MAAAALTIKFRFVASIPMLFWMDSELIVFISGYLLE